MSESVYVNPYPLSKEYAVIDEDVIVKRPGFHLHNQIGKICKVKDDGDRLKISVSFDGEIYSFCCEELALA